MSTDTLLSAAPASAPEASDRALRALLAEMQALFAGGTLREEDKKYVLDALTEAYFRTKQQGKENSHG